MCWWRGGRCKVCQSVGSSVLHSIPLPFGGEMNRECDHFQYPILSSSMSKVTPEATSCHAFCLPCQSPPFPPQSAMVLTLPMMVLTLPMMVLTLPIYTFPPSISHGAYLANDGAYLANDGAYLANHGAYLANLHLFLLNQPWCLPCQ